MEVGMGEYSKTPYLTEVAWKQNKERESYWRDKENG